MADRRSSLHRLFSELKRRKVFRVAAVYAVVGIAVMAAVSDFFPALHLPDWSVTLVAALLLVGFPIAVVLAWAFDITPEGVKRTEPEAGMDTAGPANAGAGAGFRRATLAAVAILLVVGVWMARGRSSPDDATISQTAVAVLPFSVQGGQEYAYLGEGIVNLLSTKLDGAGALRSIDARALLGLLTREGGPAPDPERGRSVAERFGAGLYVLGNIVEAGGRLHLQASLYDRTRGTRAITQATAEGEAGQLFDLVDEIAAELLAGQSHAERGARATRLAALTTHSLPALKAYLDGERQFRMGEFHSALESFQRAVVHDTSFALAHYSLSIAAEWDGRSDIALAAAEQAYRFRERLGASDRLLLDAFLAYRRGAAAEGERLYRTIVGTSPDNVEAWFQLGEVLFHYGPLQGRSTTESRAAFERVLAYEPDHVSTIWHLARVAALEGRRAELDSLVDRALVLSGEGDRTLELEALRAFALGDVAEQERILAALQSAADWPAVTPAWNVALFVGDLAGAERLARPLTAPSRSPVVRAMGHIIGAHLALAQGRWAAARSEFARAEPLDPALALEYRSLWAVARFLAVPRAELERLQGQLESWDAAAVPPSGHTNVYFNAHDGLHAYLRSYLLGLVSARLGDGSGALVQAEELQGMAPAPAAPSLPRDFAATIRAQVEWEAGRFPEALAALESAPSGAWYYLYMASPFYAQPYARYLRADLLGRLGREAEALLVLNSFEEHSFYDLPYAAPAHLRRAEIHERRGEREKAVEHYSRFVELWRNADPELQPQVRAARERLASLAGEPVRG